MNDTPNTPIIDMPQMIGDLPEHDYTLHKGGNYIHPTAVIFPGVQMGTGNYIGPYCIIGAPAEHKAYWGKSGAGVIIGDNNVITGHVTIDAGVENPTIIGNDCFIMKAVHIGHDSLVERNVTISCHVLIGGHSHIMEYANMGLGSICHQRSIIGSYSMVGMGCIVTKKTPIQPFITYVGNPAKKLHSNGQGIAKVTKEVMEDEFVRYDIICSNHSR